MVHWVRLWKHIMIFYKFKNPTVEEWRMKKFHIVQSEQTILLTPNSVLNFLNYKSENGSFPTYLLKPVTCWSRNILNIPGASSPMLSRKDYLPWPAGDTLLNAPKNILGFLSGKITLLTHVQLGVHQHLKILFCRAPFPYGWSPASIVAWGCSFLGAVSQSGKFPSLVLPYQVRDTMFLTSSVCWRNMYMWNININWKIKTN